MEEKWLQDNTVYVTLGGSQAYGLANELSDVDVKGIVVPPPSVEYHLYNKFGQAQNSQWLEAKLAHIKNPKNPKFESEIYSLRKFFLLAAEVNPNIIELLYTDPKDHFVCEPVMQKLLANRHLFLSSKARYTFAGYACDQAKKIERHRKWIVMGEVPLPNRESFGLPPVPKKGLEEVFGQIKAQVEQWNLNQFPLDEQERAELKSTLWDVMTELAETEVNVANWPDKYSDAAIHKMQKDFNLNDEVVQYIYAERQFAKAQQLYKSWMSWKKERNPARRALEEKSGYDTKHASHLVRLMRMGYEIITEGKVIVKRPDAEEIVAIKNGAWSFDQVMAFKAEMEAKLEAEYNRQKALIADGKPTPLPRSSNKEVLNKLYNDLYAEYWASKQLDLAEYG